MKQVSLTMVPLRNLSQPVNQYKNNNKRRNVPLLFRLHSQKQVNHQLRHNHNIVQKVTHQNNPHLKAQKTNHLQSKHQLNNLQQKKNLHRNKVRSLLLKVILIVVVNLITNLIKNNSLTDNDVSLSIRLFYSLFCYFTFYTFCNFSHNWI